MAPAKRSYLDHLVSELESIATTAGLEFFVDERRSAREAGEIIQAGHVVAGERLTVTRGVIDYALRSGRVFATVEVPGHRMPDTQFSWLPGDDEQLVEMLDLWRDVLSGKAVTEYEERWTHTAAAVEEDLDDIDILPDL